LSRCSCNTTCPHFVLKGGDVVAMHICLDYIAYGLTKTSVPLDSAGISSVQFLCDEE
jgi:hypothetical protein